MLPTKGDSVILTPKNWTSFQHYKDRNPPWVKLHKSLLDDRAFMSLPVASKALAPLLWLLASESKDGSFDASVEELEFRLRLSKKEIQDGLKSLIDKGFFLVASNTQADASTMHTFAVPETEREAETETKGEREKSPNGSRLPQDWTLPEEYENFCKAERPDLTPADVAARFADYWHGVAGAKGRKADWFATWRNWVRGEKRSPAAVQQVTVPAKQGIDPALAKIIAERDLVKPMPPDIREKLRR